MNYRNELLVSTFKIKKLMKKEDRICREQIVIALMAELKTPDKKKVSNILKHLKSLETQIHCWMERACDEYFYNKYWNKNGENEILNKLIKQTEKYIQKNLGCDFFINHDPRGYSIRLRFKGFYNNSFDGSTILCW